jgi:hypothetical protein
MVQIGLGGGNENPSENEIDGGTNDKPDKNSFQDTEHRPGYYGRLQWLAAGGTAHRLRTHLACAGGTFDQENRRRGGCSSRIGSWRTGSGHFKGISAVLTQQFSICRRHVRGVAFGTVHRSRAKVSQLSCQWPRDFSREEAGAPSAVSARWKNHPVRAGAVPGAPLARATAAWGHAAYKAHSSFCILHSSFTF